MRIFLPALVFLLAATALHATPYSPLKKIHVGTDPIVTGVSITPEHKKKWLAQRAAYIKCEQCVVQQPFPKDD